MKVSKKYLIWTIIVCVLALAINAYIIMHSCLDAIESTKASSGVVEVTEEVINTISPGTITPENHDSFVVFVRKAFGHFGLFFISGLLTPLATYLAISPYKGSKHIYNVIIGLSIGLLLAIVTETIQLFVEGRSGEFTDILIDFSGYLLGALIVGLILFLVIRRLNKKKQVSN